jgi:phosphoribosylformylglycinamidine cyclo-ligase
MELTTSDILPEHNISIEDCLLAPHTNYSSLITRITNAGINIKSIAHITGGGLVDNIPRVIPGEFSVEIDTASWKKIPIFNFLQNNLDINTKDLYQTFNMGIGLVLIVDESKKEKLISFIGRDNCNSIGVVVNDKDNMVHLYG